MTLEVACLAGMLAVALPALRRLRSELPDTCLWFPRIDEARQQLVEDAHRQPDSGEHQCHHRQSHK